MTDSLSPKVSKVVLLCDFFSTLGGTENYNMALAKGLRDAGIEVRIYIGEKPPLSHWTTQLVAEGIFFKEPPVHHTDLTSNLIEKDFIESVVEEINEWHPDIIHVHPFRKMAIQWLSNKKADHLIPVVATEWTVPNENAAHWFEPEAPQYINKVHTYIATCKAIEKGLRSYSNYQGNIVSIPHIIKTVPEIQPTHSDQTFRSIGCVSRLSAEKGLVFLIGAWKQVVESFPDATLHIYGHGPEESELLAIRDALGMSQQIIFEGTFKPGEIGDVAKRHSIFVQPSLFESIPTSIIELMLHGRVIIASNVGGIAELVRHNINGIITPPGSTDAIAKGIIKLLSSKELVATYSSQSFEDSHATYDYEKTINDIVALYNSILTDTLNKPANNLK